MWQRCFKFDIGSESFRVVPILFSWRHMIYATDGASKKEKSNVYAHDISMHETKRRYNHAIDEFTD